MDSTNTDRKTFLRGQRPMGTSGSVTPRVPVLPSCDLWSESPESTQLQACLFRDARIYALVVHIQTIEAVDEMYHLVGVDGDDAAEGEIIRLASKQCLIGFAFFSASAFFSHC